jgi:hypothetical protein
MDAGAFALYRWLILALVAIGIATIFVYTWRSPGTTIRFGPWDIPKRRFLAGVVIWNALLLPILLWGLFVAIPEELLAMDRQ